MSCDPLSADGIYVFSLKNVPSATGQNSTTHTDHFFVRKGRADNPLVFPKSDYSRDLLSFDGAGKDGTLNHAATGADKFRYSTDGGMNWTPWAKYEETTTVPAQMFDVKDPNNQTMVSCYRFS